jgi:hypothetical protein
MIPIDNSMLSTGLAFPRYADDILVFCDSEKASRQALASIASILDKQQRLTLQRHKTRFFKPVEFRRFCSQMIEDRPISRDEDELLKLIRRYSGGNPYRTVSYNEISPKDWKKITEKIVRGIIREYIDKAEVDYIRLRWFYRRLSQIGHPGAIDVSLEELGRVCKLQPEHDGCNEQHRMIVLGALLIPGRNPAILFEAIDQALHLVAQPVDSPIKRPRAALIPFAGNGEADPMLPQVTPDRPTAVGLIAHQAPRAPFGPATTGPFDRPLLQQAHQQRGLMPLPWGQEPGEGVPVALGPQMDVGAEAPLAAA